MTESISENISRSVLKKYYFTAQVRRAHVRAYQISGESMVAYCKKNHFALSTFKAWVTKYGKKKFKDQDCFLPHSKFWHVSRENLEQILDGIFFFSCFSWQGTQSSA